MRVRRASAVFAAALSANRHHHERNQHQSAENRPARRELRPRVNDRIAAMLTKLDALGDLLAARRAWHDIPRLAVVGHVARLGQIASR